MRILESSQPAHHALRALQSSGLFLCEAAAEIQATVTDVFIIRWSTVTATITTMDRVVYYGRTYNIAEATEIGRREGMMLRGSARAE